MFIKELRQKKQLSQEMLAELCELSLRTVQRVESGHRIGYASMRTLAAELDIDVEILEQEINKMESISTEYKDLPLWLRFCRASGVFAANRAIHQRLEIVFIVLGGLIFGIWMSNLIWLFAPELPQAVFIISLLSMFIGAYSMSASIRLGDKYDIWSRLETTIFEKRIFGIDGKKG